VRSELLEGLVRALVPLGVLDEYQTRGVFANWWDGIKYDLKTITSLGWAPTLIPEPMVVYRFFAAERDALSALEQRIAEAEAVVAEAVETAQAVLEYEPDEDETVTAATMRVELKNAIGDEETEENRPLREAAETLKTAEAALRRHRADYDRLSDELRLKVELKLYGPEDRMEETQTLLTQAEAELNALGGPPPESPPRRVRGEQKPAAEDKARLKKRKDLAADVAVLRAKIAALHTLMEAMGGRITVEQSRELILQKHHDFVAGQLQRYVQAEERALFGIFENLFAKYATSAKTLEREREATLGELESHLKKLAYL
jgi:type I restriction enzyme M protein